MLLLALGWGGFRAVGEEHAKAPENLPPIFATRSAANDPVSSPARSASASTTPMVSSRVSEVIKAKLPAYAPPAPGASADTTETPSDVVKLPTVHVNADKVKVPDDVQSLSREGFSALLRKRYPGMSTAGQDPYRVEDGSPNYARLQYETERRQEKTAAIESFSDLMERTGDAAAARRLRKELQRAVPGSTYKDPLLDAMDKSANGGRR